MRKTYLLEASVLIPLIAAEHVHHEAATAWAANVERFAICPIVEGALVRFMVRLGAAPADAQAVLRAVRARSGYEFWSDGMSYAAADLAHVRGHRQVTDAYLVSLAAEHGGTLATFDQALAHVFPDQTLLVESG